MVNFKIIALKTGTKKKFITLENQNKKVDPLKVLQGNTIYKFHPNYSFTTNELSSLNKIDDSSIDLFSQKIGNKNLSININAIVGENGSGKSSLIELLYLATYNIGCNLQLLRDPKRNELLKPFKEFELELLYQLGSDFYIVNINNGTTIKRKFSFPLGGSKLYFLDQSDFTEIDFKEYFYTITINYSHHALNALEVGKWINPLFHKNDGYQTPIVLNPMRHDGNININSEKELLKRRLQANILLDIKNQKTIDSLRNLGNDKITSKIELEFIQNYIQQKEYIENNFEQFVPHLISSIENTFNFKINKIEKLNSRYLETSLYYIFVKLKKITKNYRPYKRFSNFTPKSINSFIQVVYSSNSHIFFKIKGVILYLKYYEELLDDNLDPKTGKAILNVEDHAIKIEKIIKRERVFVNTFMLAPPSFFKSEIILDDDTTIESLSSGEKQRIHSTSSIIYHIINLNSVSDYNYRMNIQNDFHSYQYLNLVLDEIELYYHPEWQRTYINDLLLSISKINYQNIKHIKGLNIMFLTHSPYILSDIPAANVLKLKDGKPIEASENEKHETYGANIYDLLADSFFLKHYYIGEYARLEIQKLINALQSEENSKDKQSSKSAKSAENEKYIYENPEELKKRIEIISEKFLKAKLLQMYYKRFENEKALKIERLEQELKKLKEQ